MKLWIHLMILAAIVLLAGCCPTKKVVRTTTETHVLHLDTALFLPPVSYSVSLDLTQPQDTYRMEGVSLSLLTDSTVVVSYQCPGDTIYLSISDTILDIDTVRVLQPVKVSLPMAIARIWKSFRWLVLLILPVAGVIFARRGLGG